MYIYKFLAHAYSHVYMKDSFSSFSYPEIPKIYLIKEPINNETYICCKRHAELCLEVFLIKKKQKKQELRKELLF